jgi:hypothetical protein
VIGDTPVVSTTVGNSPAQPIGADAERAPAANFEDDLVVFDSPPGAEVEFEDEAEDHAPASVVAPAVATRESVSGFNSATTNHHANAVWYVHLPTGQRWGPANTDNITQWMQQGHIPASALIWRDGWPEWKLAAVAFSQPKANAKPEQHPSSQLPIRPLPEEPLVDVLTQAPATGMATIYRRSGRYPSANVTFVLLGLVIVLFALMLYVFFLRDTRPKQTTFSSGHRVETWQRFVLVRRCVPAQKC